jgi:hypothetical protein
MRIAIEVMLALAMLSAITAMFAPLILGALR